MIKYYYYCIVDFLAEARFTIIKIRRGQITKEDMWCYLTGNFRYLLLQIGLKFFIRKKVLDRYYTRVTKANRQCMEEGSCTHCGCNVPNLFMCSRGCQKNCYNE